MGERQRRVSGPPTGGEGQRAAGQARQSPRQSRRRQRQRGRVRGVRSARDDLAHDSRQVSFVPAQTSAVGASPPQARSRLIEPLHPVDDLGGRAPRDRRGLGHLAPMHPPGFPVPAFHPPAPPAAPPPPSIPFSPPPLRREQPPLPEAMQSDSTSPCGDPLAEACCYWLEDGRCDGLSNQQVRDAVSLFADEYPAVWERDRLASMVPPGGAFRNALRCLVRRVHGDGAIDSDEDEMFDALLSSCPPPTVRSAHPSSGEALSPGHKRSVKPRHRRALRREDMQPSSGGARQA